MTVNAPIDIYNIALVSLGVRPGTAVTENSQSMQFANARYEGVRDEVVAAGNWNCATTRVALTRLSSTPAWGFDNEYQLPADFMRFVRMESLDTDFRIEGDKLLTNDSEANIIYIRRLTEVAKMDEFLKNTIGLRLAARIALAVKGDVQQAALLDQEYEKQLSLANLVDANQAPVEQMSGTTWLRGRLSYGSTPYRPLENATS
jgi:hypothetical protein